MDLSVTDLKPITFVTGTRSEWTGGVAAHAAEMDDVDQAWWLS